MNIELIKGTYPINEGLDLILKMIEVKIRYHEQKIDLLDNEEDMKMREQRIKQLQNDAMRIRTQFKTSAESALKMSASIQLS